METSLSRSDLYTAHQLQREAYGPARPEPLFMMSLDFPSTYTADESPTGIEPLDPAIESSLLSAHRLERYLAVDYSHENVALGRRPSGANRATVRTYLQDIIHNIDGDVSQVGATRGTVVGSDERGCRGSVSTSASSPSDKSSEPINTNAHSSSDSLTEAAAQILLRTMSSSRRDVVTSSLAGLSQTDKTPVKSEHALASSESHHMGSDTCEQDIDAEQTLIRHIMRRQSSHDKWRVGKQARVRKHIRLRKRLEESRKDVAKWLEDAGASGLGPSPHHEH
ncbi:hypothetical protein TARUN_4985 [Trichoderma arundinaceum]|uniref:Uncharacterized protein n=1 Tax=Trichoderma arundinaceum TaxID=490622 RepID=A0A395NME4_TRIAR|nr:hypothetical protein TARUN_4985 [Trichoderma arundinaceum]